MKIVSIKKHNYVMKYVFPPQVERDDYKWMMAKYVGHIDVPVKGI